MTLPIAHMMFSMFNRGQVFCINQAGCKADLASCRKKLFLSSEKTADASGHKIPDKP